MTFTHPWVLLLLAVPVVLAWTAIGRPAGVVVPVDHAERRPRPWLARTLLAFDLVPLALLATALVILAGPQSLQEPRRERSLTNIQICLDVSGSMVGPNYDLSVEAIEDFTRAREGDAFGLTLFGVAQIRWLPLTKDLQAIRDALPFANPAFQPRHMGGTAIGAALRFCRRNMVAETESTSDRSGGDSAGDRLIILVSDGESADLDGTTSLEIGEELRASGITVFHIHIGPTSVPAAVEDLVSETGGESFAANDPDSMRAVFAHIDRMRPARFAPAGTVPLDDFGPFATVLLALAGLHGAGLLFARYTPW